MRAAFLVSPLLAALLLAMSCGSQNTSGQLGSETNWLGACRTASDCRVGDCVCGICTGACSGNNGCSEGVCTAASTPGYQSLCAETRAADGPEAVSVTACTKDEDCPAGLSCASRTCVASPEVDTGTPCALPSSSTSEEALGALNCRFEIPETAILVFLKSDANGGMRANGRSPNWLVQYRNPPRQESLNFGVSGTELKEYEPGSDVWCVDPPMVPLSSSIVVPDAAARVRARAPYDFFDFFIEQHKDFCDNPPQPARSYYVAVLGIHYTDGGDRSDWWFTYYDEQDRFQRLCGPCESNAPDACPGCTP